MVVNSGADTASSVQAAQRALASARIELARLAADGQGSGFAAGCAVHEKKMLQANMDALDQQDWLVKRCVADIAEERTRGASTRELVRALHFRLFHSFSHATLRSLCGAGGAARVG